MSIDFRRIFYIKESTLTYEVVGNNEKVVLKIIKIKRRSKLERKNICPN